MNIYFFAESPHGTHRLRLLTTPGLHAQRASITIHYHTSYIIHDRYSPMYQLSAFARRQSPSRWWQAAQSRWRPQEYNQGIFIVGGCAGRRTYNIKINRYSPVPASRSLRRSGDVPGTLDPVIWPYPMTNAQNGHLTVLLWRKEKKKVEHIYFEVVCRGSGHLPRFPDQYSALVIRWVRRACCARSNPR